MPAWWPARSLKWLLCCVAGASTCLRPQSDKVKQFEFVLPPFILWVWLHLRQAHFSCSCLLCGCAVDSASFFLSFPLPPSLYLYLLFRHRKWNALLFYVCPVFYICFLLFFYENNMSIFCCLCWPCLLLVLFRLVSCGFASFCSALFACWLVTSNPPVVRALVALFCLCLCFSCWFLVLLFGFAVFLLLPSATNIVARAPVGTPMPSSRVPP